jgi:exonuclease I
VERIRGECDVEMKQKTGKMAEHYEELLAESQGFSNKLSIEIVSYKAVIKDLQRERFQKIEEFRERVMKEKERELRETRLKNDEEVYKMRRLMVQSENYMRELQTKIAEK